MRNVCANYVPSFLALELFYPRYHNPPRCCSIWRMEEAHRAAPHYTHRVNSMCNFNTWYLYYVSVSAWDNKASPFEGVWSWVVESVWQGGPSTTVLRADLGQSSECVRAPQLHTHTVNIVYGHQWRTGNELNIIFHITFQPLTLLPSHKRRCLFFVSARGAYITKMSRQRNTDLSEPAVHPLTGRRTSSVYIQEEYD